MDSVLHSSAETRFQHLRDYLVNLNSLASAEIASLYSTDRHDIATSTIITKASKTFVRFTTIVIDDSKTHLVVDYFKSVEIDIPIGSYELSSIAEYIQKEMLEDEQIRGDEPSGELVS